jgi:biotin transporter BioY
MLILPLLGSNGNFPILLASSSGFLMSFLMQMNLLSFPFPSQPVGFISSFLPFKYRGHVFYSLGNHTADTIQKCSVPLLISMIFLRVFG